jgi:hypothetical protein
MRFFSAKFASVFFILLTWEMIALSAPTKEAVPHPKDQIALQLGAIQMGYQTPFVISDKIAPEKMQQAVNALVMGRNALNATVTSPAEKVQGAVDCPRVDSIEYRDQLYSAVCAVVDFPVVAMLKGNVVLANQVSMPVPETKLTRPSIEWTSPMRYTLGPSLSEVTSRVVDGLVATNLMPSEPSATTRVSSPSVSNLAMISVRGGTWPEDSGISPQSVVAFQLGKYEVTWSEWREVQVWAVLNGYIDLDGIGDGGGENGPVVNVSWYDVLKWCNARSEKEGLTPVYQLAGEATYRTGESVPTLNAQASGYRLPTEAEWEWAASGGAQTQGFVYSGSDDATAVAWHYNNSPEGPKTVGLKSANELGIYDMSGNVYEWCWDLCNEENPHRRFRGGSFINIPDYCTVTFRDNLGYPRSRLNSIGFRLASGPWN